MHKPRLSKTKSWAALDAANTTDLETPCKTNLKAYQDLPDELVYTEAQLEALCTITKPDGTKEKCPVFQLCQDYGRADRGATGVWGGIQHMNDRLESGSRKKEVATK